jgi:phytoene dehydrogenase-like protein
VERIDVGGGRARGLVTSDGERVAARRAVMADVVAPELFGGLVAWDDLPAGMRRDVQRFQWDNSTFKVDWALRGPVPWRAEGARAAGTVHLSDSLDEITQYSAELHQGLVPARPFLLTGQMTTADPTRAPAGSEVLWAYTHVPRDVRGDAGCAGITGRWDASDVDAMTTRVEDRIEAHAPGFKDLIVSRHVMGPGQLEEHDANLVAGAINGGTSAIHQQLVFRPLPGLGRPETPIRGLYLASSSAHPGGGVHGACGSNAARAALWAERPFGRYIGAPLLGAAGRMARGY